MEFPKHYEAGEVERKWQQYWDDERVFVFDVDAPGVPFTVDTPPPTVSGSLHIGHVYSYTQAEILVRYKRMKGFNVFYPLGFDDNGLPTERLVEKDLGIQGSRMPREEFNKKCLEVARGYEAEFKSLWRSLGFSVDWNEGYSTVDDRCMRISQRSFIELFRKGIAVKRSLPALYCPHCQTTVAQAESDDKEIPSTFVDLRFSLEDGAPVTIATTRPELLPALVAVFVHPEDERHAALVGRVIRPPLFDLPVKVLADEKVDREKGSGVVMCCTFGDTTDIEWYHKHGLAQRVVIADNGTLNDLAGPYAGLKIKAARARIIEDLEAGGHLLAKRPISHSVNLHERCGNELEYVNKPQWLVRVLDFKEDLLRRADEIRWYPEFMKERYISWVRNLKWDWCISRQRFFGVPFPVWYCEGCGEIVVARDEDLPVNPLSRGPGFACPKCGGSAFTPDSDVLDTWATSSVTPQINGKWGEQDDRMKKIYPLSLRPQAHEIIRTWAFYTIAKAHFHHDSVPWKDIMISGHVLARKGEKISKSKGNSTMSPPEMVKRHAADPIRYWAAGARLGYDGAFAEETVKEGKRMVTKIWNASKFALMSLEGYTPGTAGVRSPIDSWILARFAETVGTATRYLDAYEYALALQSIEQFFWRDLCDNYIELAKGQIRGDDADLRTGAQATLYTVVLGVLKLLAPYLPHVTEEVFQLYFRQFEGGKSLHLHRWPEVTPEWRDDVAQKRGAGIVRFVDLIRKAKSDAKLSLAHPIARLQFRCPSEWGIEEVLPQIGALLKISQWGEVEEPQVKLASDDGTLEVAVLFAPRDGDAP